MVRPIRGGQNLIPPIPNNVEAECICVPKVFDFVYLTEDITASLAVPTVSLLECGVNGAVATVTSITCSVLSEPFFPLDCVGNQGCTVLDVRPANIDGSSAKVVKVQQTIPVEISLNGTSELGLETTCTFEADALFVQQLVLSFPDGFTSDNLICRVISGDCAVTTLVPAIGVPLASLLSVDVELFICKEIQVLAQVKLEVLAKCCQPRPPIPIPPTVCPPLLCPPSSDFYPQAGCDCQAVVNTFCDVGSATCTLNLNGEDLTTGTQYLLATTCNSCSALNTTISYNYVNTEDPTQNISFTANGAEAEHCETNAIGQTQTITGTGLVTVGGSASSVAYSLQLREAQVGADAYELIIQSPGGLGGVSITAVNSAVPSNELVINHCGNFPT
ncbi:hypothetical protein [Thermoactinomyces sp. DSM 45892]|uniref:hypothetical protein n=1 Tax=Thermoactinomyces sp. DSM 45892 TaxID=1882753 RepID=UPI000895EE50|nr:hypothetical protein [Thermoactinomyces sp. DSM 45892]SDZ36128.1 hypothetical protein SAMN05444416_12520 [Thermoactinomyces sp. DSM 45892]